MTTIVTEIIFNHQIANFMRSQKEGTHKMEHLDIEYTISRKKNKIFFTLQGEEIEVYTSNHYNAKQVNIFMRCNYLYNNEENNKNITKLIKTIEAIASLRCSPNVVHST